MVTWLENSPIFGTSLISIFLLFALIALGWILRTRLKISLGLLFNIFSLFAAVGIWILLNHKYGLLKSLGLHSFAKWYAAIIIFFAVIFLIKVFSVFFRVDYGDLGPRDDGATRVGHRAFNHACSGLRLVIVRYVF